MENFIKSDTIENLIEQLKKLPAVGKKSATRLAFHLLKSSRDDTLKLANAIIEVKERLRFCSNCYNISEEDPCSLCRSNSRDGRILCVVEQPEDTWIIEDTGEFKGKYHVLLGVISPIDGVTPSDLKIAELITRIEKENIEELLIATNPTLEGDSTALYIHKEVEKYNLKVSRLAMGLPAGSNLEFSDRHSLANAILNRKEI